MSPAVVRDELISVIDGLFKDEWFTPRVSSALSSRRLYAEDLSALWLQEDVSEPLKNLRDGYFNLCRDDTPMVRRAAAKNMSAVVRRLRRRVRAGVRRAVRRLLQFR